MFTDLFEEYAKEVITPGNELERPKLAAGYNKHAEARVLEVLKTIDKMLDKDVVHGRMVLKSRISEMEDGDGNSSA